MSIDLIEVSFHLSLHDDPANSSKQLGFACDAFADIDDALGEIDARHTAANAVLAADKPEEAIDDNTMGSKSITCRM
eukprot:3047667-Amphidinium_carterae.1